MSLFVPSITHLIPHLQDTFPIRAHNDPFMTRRRRRLLIPIIHLITRIYHAYRLCTDQVRPPFAFRIIQGRLVPVSSSLVRDLLSFATPSTNQKFYIIKLLSSHQWVLFACTLYIMYYQGCRFYLICTNTSYVTPGFFSYYSSGAWTPFFFSFSSYAKWPRSLSLVIMRVFTLGLVFCFTLILICVIN